ncbi:MAG: hypothetical protein IT239_03150 [Bacteroidia bacterium]|nr:hypothetical protein [Bacteroidia bacterium]
METKLNISASRTMNNFLIFLTTIFLLLFVASKGFSQEKTATSEEPNKAMKSVFKELKSDDSSMGTFLMIGGVVAVVGVAMYMSFKGGDSSPKSRLKVKGN